MNEKYQITCSKGRKEVKFEPGDLVWLYLGIERFPDLRKSKLMSCTDGPFKILEKVNDNAYKLELPLEFVVSPHLTFQIYGLTWEKKMRFNRGRHQFKRERMMRTSLHRIQPLLPLRCRDQLRDHEHND
jgi:hypothetical protein